MVKVLKYGLKMQRNAHLGQFLLLKFLFSSMSHLIKGKKKDKFIEKPIPKFDNGELVDNKDLFIFYDKCIILEE